MSELFVELFSEEIPAKLQVNARRQIKKIITNFFIVNQIKFNENFTVFSTPNRLVLHVDKIPNEITIKSQEIRGPTVNAPEKALMGFIKSNNTSLEKIFKKNTDKGEFFFFKKESKKNVKQIQTLFLDRIDRVPAGDVDDLSVRVDGYLYR